MRLLCTLVLLAAPVLAQRQAVHPKEFPTGRPFSPGIKSGGTLFVAGMTGNDLKTGKYPESFDEEVKNTLNSIGLVLKEGGMSFDDVQTVNVYLTDMALFPDMNKTYITYFKEPRPARTTVGVAKLVGTARIEITVTAHKKQ